MKALMVISAGALLISTWGAGAVTVTVDGGTPAAVSGIPVGLVTTNLLATTEPFSTAAGCGAQFVSISGEFGTASNSRVNRRLRPESDRSCCLHSGRNRLVAEAVIAFPAPSPGDHIDYIGLYWGSIDSYNYVVLLNGAGNPVAIPGFGFEIDGLEASSLSASGALNQSLFVEFALSAADDVRALRVRTTNFAFELENLAWAYANGISVANLVAIDPALSVSAPPGALLFAMGAVVMFAGVRRRGWGCAFSAMGDAEIR